MTPSAMRRSALSAFAMSAVASGRTALLALVVAGSPALAHAQDNEAAATEAPNSVLETYRDWVVRCAQAEGQPRRCEMAQELRQDDGRLVFATLVQRTDMGEAGMVFVAPFGVALSEGLRFTWDDAAAWDVPFATCYAAGCLAEKVADDEELALLRRSNAVTVGMRAHGGDAVELSVSLAGFSAAWRRLEALATDADAP